MLNENSILTQERKKKIISVFLIFCIFFLFFYFFIKKAAFYPGKKIPTTYSSLYNKRYKNSNLLFE